MVSFRAPEFVPLTQFSFEKCIFLPQGDAVQNVTYAENRGKYALFLPKLFAYTSSY